MTFGAQATWTIARAGCNAGVTRPRNQVLARPPAAPICVVHLPSMAMYADGAWPLSTMS